VTASSGPEGADGNGRRRAIQIVRGEPSDLEIAAVVSALVAAASVAHENPNGRTARSQWRNRARNIRPPLGAGPGAWRASGLPR
jgi:hypothetical protein